MNQKSNYTVANDKQNVIQICTSITPIIFNAPTHTCVRVVFSLGQSVACMLLQTVFSQL